jgi:hypothetical protein
MGVYLPVGSSDTQFSDHSLGTAAEERSILKSSLARKVRDHIGTLPKAGQSPSVAEWFWQRFEGLTRNSDWEVILVGDFNRLWPKEGSLTSVFQKKCADHGITNPAAAALRSRGVPYLSTCNKAGDMKNGLDHVLATLPPESLRGAGILVCRSPSTSASMKPWRSSSPRLWTGSPQRLPLPFLSPWRRGTPVWKSFRRVSG